MQSLVSVVIPTYNRAEDLQRALQSVVNQTYSNWEAIVVDNNSIDSTDEVVMGFNDRRIKLLKIDNGGVIAASRNLGIRNSKADYVAFLDSDDWWSPNKLQRCMEIFSKGADVVYHNLYLAQSKDQLSFPKRTAAANAVGSVITSLLSRGLSIPNSSAMIRVNILRSVGFLSEDKRLVSVEDLDLWLRISKLTNNFRCISECLGYYWVGGGNLSTSSWGQIKKIRYLYSIHLQDISEALRLESNSFLYYRIAKISLNLGKNKYASKYFHMALSGKLSCGYRFKSLYFLFKLRHEK